MHPYHHHGNNSDIIAKDGRLLESTPGAGADLSFSVYTIQSIPGETVDAIFKWTGVKMGWDIYGTLDAGEEFAHTCSGVLLDPDPNVDTTSNAVDPVTFEDCNYHGEPIPVLLPEKQDMAFGGFWSGSPYLGAAGALPPGEGGLNPYNAFTFPWHSHSEKELTNWDIFPGGMFTMLFVVPPGTPF